MATIHNVAQPLGHNRIVSDSDAFLKYLFTHQLWKELRPDSPLSGRISKQWCEIGFQGNDPKTDFRGMGLLGLHNLLWVENLLKWNQDKNIRSL